MSDSSSPPSSTQNTSIFPTSTASSTPNSSPPQSSSLYLFTFLATLLLLLAVSCAIVIRSFILRRRFRRRIEEAIAAGVLIPGALDDPGSGMGRRRRDFGEKPKLWEVWVGDHEQTYDSEHEGNSMKTSLGKSEGKWDEILPVSATILTSNAPKPIPLPGSESAPSLATLDHQAARHRFVPHIFRRQHDHRTPTPPPAQSPPQQQNGSEPQLATYPPSVNAKDRDPDEDKLQVSVLISMPNPNARRSYGSDSGGESSLKGKEKRPGADDGDFEGDIPDVVFGVAEVGFRS